MPDPSAYQGQKEWDDLWRSFRKNPVRHIKGPQFNPRDVPIIEGSPAGQLMYDPTLSGREDPLFLAQKGTDSVPAMLTPHEAVLNVGAADILGRDKIRMLNTIGQRMQAGNEDVTNPLFQGVGMPASNPTTPMGMTPFDFSNFLPQGRGQWMPADVKALYQAVSGTGYENLRPAQLMRVAMGLGPAPPRPHVGPPPHPTMMLQAGTSNVPYVPISDPNDPRLANTPLNDPTVNPLLNLRAKYLKELEDPVVREQLYKIVHNEVGSSNPQRTVAFLESMFNRADARGQTLGQAASDRAYYDKRSFRDTNVTPADRARYDQYIQHVAGGSNISNLATGNASGSVGFAGGPQTFQVGTERFGREGSDLTWVQKVSQIPGLPAPEPYTGPYRPAGSPIDAVASAPAPTAAPETSGTAGTTLLDVSSSIGSSILKAGAASQNRAQAGMAAARANVPTSITLDDPLAYLRNLNLPGGPFFGNYYGG